MIQEKRVKSFANEENRKRLSWLNSYISPENISNFEKSSFIHIYKTNQSIIEAINKLNRLLYHITPLPRFACGWLEDHLNLYLVKIRK